MNTNELNQKYAGVASFEDRTAIVKQEVEVGGLNYGKVIMARCYLMNYWQSPDGRVRRVYIEVEGQDVTHEYHHGEPNAARGREWCKAGHIPFGFFEMTNGKLAYRPAKNGNHLNGKSSDQPHMREIAADMLS